MVLLSPNILICASNFSKEWLFCYFCRCGALKLCNVYRHLWSILQLLCPFFAGINFYYHVPWIKQLRLNLCMIIYLFISILGGQPLWEVVFNIIVCAGMGSYRKWKPGSYIHPQWGTCMLYNNSSSIMCFAFQHYWFNHASEYARAWIYMLISMMEFVLEMYTLTLLLLRIPI